MATSKMTTMFRSAIRHSARNSTRRTLIINPLNRPAALLLQNGLEQVRHFGVFQSLKDSVSQKVEERNSAKQQQMYKEQMKDLAHTTSFDLDDFQAHLKKNADASGINGWRSMIPGVSDMTAVQQMKAFLEILDTIDPEFKKNPRLINGKVKRQITQKSGHSAEEINNLLRNYEQISGLRQWLVKRVERGLHIPESMEETTGLVRQDPTGFPTKMFRTKQRRY